MSKEILLDGSVVHSVTLSLPERPAVRTVTERFEQGRGMIPSGSESSAWVSLGFEGITFHWLEPKRE